MNTRKYSGHQEKRIAKKIGAHKQSNSGATAFQKGDLIMPGYLIECKTMVTEKASISIKKDWLDKVAEEAFAMNRPNWILAFNFGGLDNPDNFYIINEALLKRLLQEEITHGTETNADDHTL